LLFANTRTGAASSAVLYSMVETAKINGLEPYKYLTELFEKLPTANTPEAFAKLLPYCSRRQPCCKEWLLLRLQFIQDLCFYWLRDNWLE